jgi:modulator of FtsH protease
MQGWETTVSTGSPDHDRMTVDHYRAQANASGMDLHVQPLPQGGFFVRAVPMQAQAPQWQPQPAYATAVAPGSVGSPAVPERGAAQPLASERLAYLRKVYGLLGTAAFLAIASGWALLELSPVAKYTRGGIKFKAPTVVMAMLETPALMYGAFGLLFVMTFVASWTSKVKYLNVAMLMLVAVLMGVELAPMVMVAQILGGAGKTLSTAPVRDAFLMTGAVFAGVTGYVFVSRKDFSFLGAIVSMGVLVVFVASILALAFDSEIFTLAVCSVGALVAGLFLMWQTWWVLKGDMDDPVEDALVFLVQLRNLFMFVLRIFMSRD